MQARQEWMMRICSLITGTLMVIILVSGCGRGAGTAPAEPAADTRQPETATDVPPEATATTRPTSTSAPAPQPTTTATDKPEPSPTHAATSAPEAAELDPGEGVLLFSHYPDGDIGIMHADGSGMEILHDESAGAEIQDNRHASWSPDGKRISYTVDDYDQAEIWIMDRDGENQRLLFGEAATDSSHSWAPDGSAIAFVSAENRIAVHDLAAHSSRLLTGGEMRSEKDPAWSPDGSQIAFCGQQGGNYDIYVINLDGSGLTRITSNADVDRYPTWSPDGGSIAFSSTRDGDHIADIFRIDLAHGGEESGNTPVRLTSGDTLDIDPDWGPGQTAEDGIIVYAAHSFGAAHATLFIMDASGISHRQVTRENLYHSPRWQP